MYHLLAVSIYYSNIVLLYMYKEIFLVLNLVSTLQPQHYTKCKLQTSLYHKASTQSYTHAHLHAAIKL